MSTSASGRPPTTTEQSEEQKLSTTSAILVKLNPSIVKDITKAVEARDGVYFNTGSTPVRKPIAYIPLFLPNSNYLTRLEPPHRHPYNPPHHLPYLLPQRTPPLNTQRPNLFPANHPPSLDKKQQWKQQDRDRGHGCSAGGFTAQSRLLRAREAGGKSQYHGFGSAVAEE